MNKQPVKVLFFTTRLGKGGAEKLLLRIINNLDSEKFRLYLALCQTGGEYEGDLAKNIEVYTLVNRQKIAISILLSWFPLRRLIKDLQPDLVCGILDNVNVIAILATLGLVNQPKTVLSVHAPLSFKYSYQVKQRLFNKLIYGLIPHTYPFADSIICVSNGVAEDLSNLIPKTKNLLQVIYNPCVDEEVLTGAQQTPPETLPDGCKLIVACGRLNPEKGFKDLITALVSVRKVINAHLWIIGDGELKSELLEQIDSLGLTDLVKLLGFKMNPYQYMAKADLFVCASIYEGFGNVIVEAMACETPVVSTDCPYGPREIIDSGVNGLLIQPPGDPGVLAEGIIQVLTNDDLQKRLIQEGKKRAEDFQTDKISQKYASLFLSKINEIA